MTGIVRSYAHEHGGRVGLLFLLFLLAIYSFINSGLNTFAIVCLIPAIIGLIYFAFKWNLFLFWCLILVNYFIQFINKNGWLPSGLPLSLPNELLEISIIAVMLIDIRKERHFGRSMNFMFFAITLWTFLCILELFNDTCQLGINVSAWFVGFRLMASQLLYFVIIFSICMDTPQTINKYLRFWAFLSLFSVFWTWKQQYIGLTPAESAWLSGTGGITHVVNGITRYWSTFNDAASYGCNAAATSVAFFIFALTTKINKDRILFLITGAAVLWGMFSSGTRVAMACFFLGLLVYIFLSKSAKLAVPIIIFGLVAFILLAFTNIGQGNSQIRRMRTVFNKNDASANARDINQATMAKYLQDAPWGIGISIRSGDVPARNKYALLSMIAPDSEYVYIWIHTGRIGIAIFLLAILMMLAGACWIVLFKIKNRALCGIGAGLCCAFTAMQLAAYGNQVLFQYPNGLIFFGGLAMVYVLPYIEKDWVEYEQSIIVKQEEKKRLKLEKKLASRV